MKRLSLLWLFLLVAAGCEEGGGAGAAPGGGGGGGGGGDAGTVCARPDPGCACDPGAPPVECYGEPTREGTATMCHRGLQYCRDGVYSECETLETFELDRTFAALITGPSECNPCNPDCSIARDYPDDGDLTPSNSSGVVYDPSAGGVVLDSGGTTTSMLPDGDGDGVPDTADSCPGTGWRLPCDGSATDDGYYHTLPYGGAAAIDPLSFNVQVRTADVYFLMDTTGSMGGEIANLRADLTSGTFLPGCPGGIIGAIRCTIPDAWFGVGGYDDYPTGSYGFTGDLPYYHRQDITSSIGATQTAVNGLVLHSGADWPESQSQALYSVATGSGLLSYVPSRASSSFGACPAGRWGYPCFRDGTIPIVINFTDAPFHNGPNPAYNYSLLGGSSLPSSATAVSGNDRWSSVRAIGDVTTRWISFTGDTGTLSEDYNYGCNAAARDAVFSFTLSATTTVTITTEGSSYDTVLTVLNGARSTAWCNDDAIGLQSALTLTLTAGTYYVIVDGWSTSAGAYRLNLAVPPGGVGAITWPQTLTALRDRGIKVISVQSGGAGTDGESDCRALANGTGSTDSAGSPYVFNISDTGSGLSRAVVDAVVDLANYSRMDVTARAVDNATTPAIDERGFVNAIRAVSWGPGSCVGISGGNTFVQCLPGTGLNFEVTFRNDFVMPTTVAQVFDFTIEVVGNGTYVLTTVPVRIVVPPSVPTYPPSGTYQRDYDSTTRCALPSQRPDWGSLTWTATTPPDSRIRFDIRAADGASGLGTATPVSFTVPGTAPPVDIGNLLVAAGQTNYKPYLRITTVLFASTDRTISPTLTGFEVQFTCTSFE